MITLDSSQTIFTNRLLKSKDAVELVAEYLKNQGHNVRVGETRVTPDRAHWREYADHGDIETFQRIEVKGLKKVCFTCKEDFPYGDMIICNKHSFDEADPKPLRYYIVSADRKAMAIISVPNTREYWYARRIFDGDYKEHEDKYMVSTKHVNFIRFEEC